MDFDSIRREREARRGVFVSDSSESQAVPPPQSQAGIGGARSRITTVFSKPESSSSSSASTSSTAPASRFATLKSTTAAAQAAQAPARREPGPLDQVAQHLGVAGKTVTVPPIPALGFTVPTLVPLIHVIALGVGISFLLFRGYDPLMTLVITAAGSYMIVSSAAAAKQQQQQQ